jgi:hypothetical protein
VSKELPPDLTSRCSQRPRPSCLLLRRRSCRPWAWLSIKRSAFCFRVRQTHDVIAPMTTADVISAVPPQLPMQHAGPTRFGRIVLAVFATLACIALGACAFVMPVFSAMFADFGAPLPRATTLVLSSRAFYVLAAIIFETGILYLLYGPVSRRKNYSAIVLLLLVMEYLVVVTTLAALFMPILQLGAVAKGT